VLEASITFKENHSRAHEDFGQQNYIKIIKYHNYHTTYYNNRTLEEFDKEENREIAEGVIKKPNLLTVSNTNPINAIAYETYYSITWSLPVKNTFICT
jgi:hypothetical protein